MGEEIRDPRVSEIKINFLLFWNKPPGRGKAFAMMEEANIPGITTQEEKELLRVFECLCDYAEKQKIRVALKPVVSR